MGTFSQHLIPTSDKTYDIGSLERKWRNGYFDGLIRSWESYTRTIKAFEKENLDLTVQTEGTGIGLANEVPSWVEVRPRGRPVGPGQKFDSNPFTIVSAYWDPASNRKEQLELFIQVIQTGAPDGYVKFNFRRTYPEGGVIEWESDFLKVYQGEGFPRIPAGKLYLEGAYGELQFWESDSSKWIVAKRESTHGTQPNRLIFSFFDGANWKEMLHLDPLNNRLIPGVPNLDIGSAANPWRNLIINGYGNLGSLQIGGTPVVTSGRVLQNIASVGCNLIPDANLTRDLGSATVAWNNIYTGYGYVGRLTVTDQIRDNSNTYQMAKIVRYSGTSRNTPAWVFFPTNQDFSLLPATSNFGYIGETDRYWYYIYARTLYYKVTPSSFSCPGKLKETPVEEALGVEVEKKTLPKKLKVRYKGPMPHSEEAYIVKDLIRERLGLDMAPLEREYLKHLLEKHNRDFDKAYEEAKNFFQEEFNTEARAMKERLEKKMPIEDEVNLDELIEKYGEQAVAEALEILKFELHNKIEIAEQYTSQES